MRDNARWLGLTHRIFGLVIWHDETFAAPRLDVGAAIRAATDRVAAVAPWLQPRGADGFALAGRVGYGENLLRGWAPLIERWLIAQGDVDDGKSEAATLSDLDGDDAEAIAESYGGLFVRLAEWGVSSFDLAMPLFGADPLVNEPNLVARSRAAGIEPADLLVVTAIETLVLGSLFAEDELVALLEVTMLEYHLNQRVDVTSLIRDGWSIDRPSIGAPRVQASDPAVVVAAFRPTETTRSVEALQRFRARLEALVHLTISTSIAGSPGADALHEAHLALRRMRQRPPEFDLYVRAALGVGIALEHEPTPEERDRASALLAERTAGGIRTFLKEPLLLSIQ